MRDYSNLKDIDNSKKWNIVLRTSKGFIEALNSNRSFNVYRSLGIEERTEFYRSCYGLDTAKRILKRMRLKKAI